MFNLSEGGIYLPGSSDRSTFTTADGASFWAENGMVCQSRPAADGRREDFRQTAPSEMRFRLRRIIDLAKHSREVNGVKHAKTKLYRQVIEGLEKVIAAAEHQGPFENESCRRDRARRVPKSVFISKG